MIKITKIEAIELRLPESKMFNKATSAQNSLIIKIYTNKGIVGIGEVDSCPHVVKAIIEAPFSHSMVTGFGRLLIGMNPLDIKVINDKLYRASVYYGRRGVVLHTIGGIDIALWDIAGKYYNKPVYQLLGGAFHKKIRAYASSLFGKNGSETASIGKKLVEKGFTAVKFGWNPMGENEEKDLELVEGARKGVGDKCDLIIDAGCCWDAKTAIRRTKQFEKYNIFWLEEPLDQDDLNGYEKLSTFSTMPIASGEGVSGIFAWRNFIKSSKIDIAQIDIARNGFTESVRMADIAEEYGLRVVNHFFSTGINLAAGLHFLASRKNTFIFEYCVEETTIRKDVTEQKFEIDKDGFVSVPEEPGLGINLNEEIINKYTVIR